MAFRYILSACLVVLAGCSRPAQPGTPLEVKGLAVELPAGWTAVPPISPMRAAQAVIEGPGGPAELTVFHFGIGEGGDPEANIERWLGQIVPEAGTTPKREVFEGKGGIRVSWVDVEGTLRADRTGMGPRTPIAGSRLMGAVVEGEGGPWFFKVTGPDLTLSAQRLPFRGMLQRARVVK